MKITPLEIRQKGFEKVFRGFDKDEVNAFLMTLSNQWERTLDEQKELRYKLEAAEKEVAKLREVESSLFKTLKTADDTATNLVEQASKAADLHMRETQMKAEALLNEAKNKARAIMEKAEVQAREIIEDMHDEVRTLEQTYKAIENHRDNLINDLKLSSSDLIEKVEKLEKNRNNRNFDEQLKKAKVFSRAKNEIFSEEDTTLRSSVEISRLTIAEQRPLKKDVPKVQEAKKEEQVKEKRPVQQTEAKKILKVAGEEYNLEEVGSTGSFFDELN